MTHLSICIAAKLGQKVRALKTGNPDMPVVQELRNLLSIETAGILLYLSLFSELGVLTRIYVGRLFNDGCYNGWGLCLTSGGGRDKTYGAQFTDLPANMLGCFVMGLLSTAAVLGLKSKKSLAFLPASHHWQKQNELLVGLRTGYCGSLTTFASWEFSLIQLLVGVKSGDGGQWQQWLWGWIVGFELAFASHLIGEHTALFIDSKVLQDEPTAEMTLLERPTEAAEEGEDLYGSQELKEVLDGDQHTNGHHQEGTSQHRQKQGKLQITALQRPTEAAQDAEDLYGTGLSDQPLQPSNIPKQNIQRPAKPRQSTSSKDSSTKSTVRSKLTVTFLACVLLCLVLTVLWVVLAVVDSERKHSGRRQQWFALLFAPFGCILRWLLSKLNTGSNRKILPWFPLGTFLANMIACCIDFIIGGVTNKYSLGYWPAVILPAIRVGYAGSLSTVSTFIAEVSITLVFTVHACLRNFFAQSTHVPVIKKCCHAPAHQAICDGRHSMSCWHCNTVPLHVIVSLVYGIAVINNSHVWHQARLCTLLG